MVRVVEDSFGTAVNPLTNESEEIRRFTLTNDNQMSVQIITLGATITSLNLPDASGSVDDCVLGFERAVDYLGENNPYFGSIVGRVCNRVGNATFKLDGCKIELSKNLNGKHHLHGGFIGFNKVFWKVTGTGANCVTMEHCSTDGHEGYPGDVIASVHFELTEDNCLIQRMAATCNKTTPVNMTNHSYFNLAGHASGSKGLFEHLITIQADKMTETDEDSIPTGGFIALEGTSYDLRKPRKLGDAMKKLEPKTGFDDNYCINLKNDGLTLIARASHPPSGRWLEITSNQPGVQFYTANSTGANEPIVGKCGATYSPHSAFCLETGKYPDSVNHDNFPSTILKPGEKYCHEVIYRFGVKSDD